MKPLFLRADNSLTAGCFIGVLGLSLAALAIFAETPAFAEEIGMTKRGEATTSRLLAQAVTAIEVRPETDLVTVVVAGDGQLFPEANFLDESRLIVDIPAVSSALRRSVIRADHYLLKKIRLGHHADKVRLVFDVSERPIFSLAREENKVLITLKPSEHKIPTVVAAQFDGERERILFTPRPRKMLFESGDRVGKRMMRMVGPTQSQFKVQRVQMAGDSVPVEKADRSDDIVAGQTRYVGRRISLDFQQADITNILRLIAEVSGFNIVVGEGVKSKVTMKLVSVPWDQALDMLLKMNGLGMIRQGSIVWIDSLTNIAKQQDEEARAKESKSKAEDLVTRVIYVQNIAAQELQTTLRQYISPRGLMQVNQASNALVVRDTESQVVAFAELVRS